MNMIDAVKTVFKKYATFSGRAIRSEFWWFMLFVAIVQLILGGWAFSSMMGMGAMMADGSPDAMMAMGSFITCKSDFDDCLLLEVFFNFLFLFILVSTSVDLIFIIYLITLNNYYAASRRSGSSICDWFLFFSENTTIIAGSNKRLHNPESKTVEAKIAPMIA